MQQNTEQLKNNSFLKRNWKQIHEKTHFVSLILFAISLPTSEFGMSISMFALFGNWLIDIFLSNHLYNTPLNKKLKLFWQNKAALLLFSILIIHALGAIYTNDISNAIKDLRIKIPIGLFALVLGSEKQLSQKQFHQILMFFVLTVFTASIICFTVYLRKDYLNIRDISLFISHIRFGLMISLSIFLTYYLIIKRKYHFVIRIGLVVLSIWLFAYLFITENITGISITFIVLLMLLFYALIISKKKIIKYISIVTLLAAPLIAFLFLKSVYKDVYQVKDIDLSNLDVKTVNGNKYYHDTTIKHTENGYYVSIYLSTKELRSSWNKVSKINYWDQDTLGQDVRFTLIRYMTSKGLRKDSAGLSKLNQYDIEAIEKGIPNYKFVESSSIKKRIHQLLWEVRNYQLDKSASGHSLTMRLEFWKIGFLIIKEHPVIGIGTGSIKQAYNEKYLETNSKLDVKWRYLSHNQFIYITVSLGIIGLLWFLFSLFYPLIARRRHLSFPFAIFFLIVFLSFFTEDTLTSQAGVCFFAFFYPLLMFNPNK